MPFLGLSPFKNSNISFLCRFNKKYKSIYFNPLMVWGCLENLEGECRKVPQLSALPYRPQPTPQCGLRQ